MPRVGTYQRQNVVENVDPNLRSTVRVGADNYNTGVKEAASAVSQTADLYVKEVKAANEVRALQKSEALKRKINEVLYTPGSGKAYTKGQNSFTALQDANKELEPYVNDLTKDLNPSQKALFEGYKQKTISDMDLTLNKHMGKERVRFDEETTSSFLENERNGAVYNFTDPEYVEQTILRQQDAVIKKSERLGYSNDATKLELLSQTSKTRTGVITQMIDSPVMGGAKFAEAYLNKFEGDMLPDDVAKLRKALKEGIDSQWAMEKSDEIFDSSPDATKALAEVNKIKEVEKRDEVKKRLMQKYDEVNGVEKIKKDDDYLWVVNQMERQKGVLPKDISPSKWATFTLAERRALEQHAKGGEDKTINDNDAWLNFLEMGKNNSNQLKKLTRTEFESAYWSRFDQTHKAKAETMWQKLGKGKADAKAAFTNTMSVQQRLQNSLMNSGLYSRTEDNDGRKDVQNERLAKLNDEVTDRLEETEKELGRKARPTEIQKVIDEILLDKVTYEKDTFLGFGKPVQKETVKLFASEEQLKRQVVKPQAQTPEDKDRIRKLKNRVKSYKGYNLSDSDAVLIDSAMRSQDTGTVETILEKYK